MAKRKTVKDYIRAAEEQIEKHIENQQECLREKQKRAADRYRRLADKRRKEAEAEQNNVKKLSAQLVIIERNRERSPKVIEQIDEAMIRLRIRRSKSKAEDCLRAAEFAEKRAAELDPQSHVVTAQESEMEPEAKVEAKVAKTAPVAKEPEVESKQKGAMTMASIKTWVVNNRNTIVGCVAGGVALVIMMVQCGRISDLEQGQSELKQGQDGIKSEVVNTKNLVVGGNEVNSETNYIVKSINGAVAGVAADVDTVKTIVKKCCNGNKTAPKPVASKKVTVPAPKKVTVLAPKKVTVPAPKKVTTPVPNAAKSVATSVCQGSSSVNTEMNDNTIVINAKGGNVVVGGNNNVVGGTVSAPKKVTVPAPKKVTVPAPKKVTVPAPKTVTVPTPKTAKSVATSVCQGNSSVNTEMNDNTIVINGNSGNIIVGGSNNVVGAPVQQKRDTLTTIEEYTTTVKYVFTGTKNRKYR